MHDINNSFTYAYSAGTDADFLQNVNQSEISTNVIDLDTTLGISIVGSKGPYLIIKCPTAGATSGSIEMQLISSTHADLTSGTSDIIGMWRFTHTVMAAGTLLVNQQLPIGKYRKYLGIKFISWTTTCAGVEAFLSDSPETPASIPSSVTAGS